MPGSGSRRITKRYGMRNLCVAAGAWWYGTTCRCITCCSGNAAMRWNRFTGETIRGENLTVDGPLMDGRTTTLCLTNCILTKDYGTAAVVNDSHNGLPWGAAVGGIRELTGPYFQTAGGGSYYLANGSACRQAGTTNLEPTLLAELAGG